jgi:hypothetical protein
MDTLIMEIRSAILVIILVKLAMVQTLPQLVQHVIVWIKEYFLEEILVYVQLVFMMMD